MINGPYSKLRALADQLEKAPADDCPTFAIAEELRGVANQILNMRVQARRNGNDLVFGDKETQEMTQHSNPNWSVEPTTGTPYDEQDEGYVILMALDEIAASKVMSHLQRNTIPADVEYQIGDAIRDTLVEHEVTKREERYAELMECNKNDLVLMVLDAEKAAES